MASRYPAEIREYLLAGPRRAMTVESVRPYCVHVRFDDGVLNGYDMKEELTGVLAPLTDYALFERVYIDDLGAIAWDVDGKHLDTSKDTVYIYGRTVE